MSWIFVCQECKAMISKPREFQGYYVCPRCNSPLRFDWKLSPSKLGFPMEQDLDQVLSRIKEQQSRSLANQVIELIKQSLPGTELIPIKHDYLSIRISNPKSRTRTLGWIAVRNYGIGVELNSNEFPHRMRISSLDHFRDRILPILKQMYSKLGS